MCNLDHRDLSLQDALSDVTVLVERGPHRRNTLLLGPRLFGDSSLNSADDLRPREFELRRRCRLPSHLRGHLQPSLERKRGGRVVRVVESQDRSFNRLFVLVLLVM